LISFHRQSPVASDPAIEKQKNPKGKQEKAANAKKGLFFLGLDDSQDCIGYETVGGLFSKRQFSSRPAGYGQISIAEPLETFKVAKRKNWL